MIELKMLIIKLFIIYLLVFFVIFFRNCREVEIVVVCVLFRFVLIVFMWCRRKFLKVVYMMLGNLELLVINLYF